MRRHLLISSSMIGLILSGPAMAADVIEAPVEIMPAGAAYDWTGFYGAIGGGSELGIGELSADGLSLDGLSSRGFFGEVTFGYDYMFANGLVLGVLADARYSGSEFELEFNGTSLTAEFDYGADAALRVGTALTPSTLGYVLAGYSYQDLDLPDALDLGDNDLHGFIVGVGAETALTDRLSIRREYRYRQYGDEDLGGVDLDLSVHSFHTALAYRFGGGYSRPAEPLAETNLTGFYIGASGLAGAVNTDINIELAPDSLSIEGVGGDGIGAEASVGYDHDFGTIVVGALATARFSNASIDLEGLGAELSIEFDYGFDALLRAGYQVDPAALAYVVGGYSYQHIDFDAGALGSFEDDLNGLTIGTGVETAVTDHVSVNLEYRYTFFETPENDFGGGNSLEFEPSAQSARLGLKYKF